MNRSEFFKTFGMGVAAATLAPRTIFADKEKKIRENYKRDIQNPDPYIAEVRENTVVIYEAIDTTLQQGRVMFGKLYDLREGYGRVTKINVGNFKPEPLFYIKPKA